METFHEMNTWAKYLARIPSVENAREIETALRPGQCRYAHRRIQRLLQFHCSLANLLGDKECRLIEPVSKMTKLRDPSKIKYTQISARIANMEHFLRAND